ncbi:MAG: acetyl-CoA hydrolase/transferase family protein [Eubacterium sp.]
MADIYRLYRERKTELDHLAESIQSGWKIFMDAPLGQPLGLIRAIETRVKQRKLGGITFHILLDAYRYFCYQEPDAGRILGVSWFSGAGARDGINRGCGDIMPFNYHEGSELLRKDVKLDAWILQAAPMDEEGYFNTCNGSLGKVLLEQCPHIYVQVNENLPKVCGAPRIHITQIEKLAEKTEPLLSLPSFPGDEISMKIGELVAERIPDGATVQFGIGAIPDAVGKALKNKKHLGIHTELLTNRMIELMEAGAVDNSKKPIDTGVSVAAFALGSQHMYETVDSNPYFRFLPVDYVNEPNVIAEIPNFMSINSALEVDFFGQVCAESIGTRHISGTGGQLDFVRGANASAGGKSFICFPSTAENGKVSRIKPILTPGAIVTTGKNESDYIVTEYGVAKMRGKSVRQRTEQLINIAHPKFREELKFAARKRYLI